MAQDHLTIENNKNIVKPLVSPSPDENVSKDNMTNNKGLSGPASIIENGPLRVVITNSPTNVTMEQHIRELVKLNVKHVCRACEPTYNTDALTAAKIQVHDLAFPDGDPPTEQVIADWLVLIENLFVNKKSTEFLKTNERISVHCVAGLGRAPVLVAVALIELCKLGPLEAVERIRKVRRGAINRKQLRWLEQYNPRKQNSCLSISSVMGLFFKPNEQKHRSKASGDAQQSVDNVNTQSQKKTKS